jgi:hypothetical protein
MQEGMSLMYSWDPRVRRWVKEASQQDAPPPPAEPVDNEAVQTFYFDPQDERWIGTILGDVGRRIAAELGDRYRGPAVTELAMQQEGPRRRVVPTPDQVRRIPKLAWLLGVLIAAGVAAWAAWAPLPPAPPIPLP